MGRFTFYLIVLVIATSWRPRAVFAVGSPTASASRRRPSAAPKSRPLRILKDAERDADTRKKEALLEAKEKAHELRMDAERQAREMRQQPPLLEQTLARREAAFADRTRPSNAWRRT